MRALLRFTAFVAAILSLGLGASAAYSSTPALTDGQKMWLAFHVPHLPPPAGIACVMRLESGANYRFPVVLFPGQHPNGYEGAGQWVPSTWRSAAVAAGWGIFAGWHVYDVPPGVQDQVMSSWAHLAGWSQWPNTSRMCGLWGRGP